MPVPFDADELPGAWSSGDERGRSVAGRAADVQDPDGLVGKPSARTSPTTDVRQQARAGRPGRVRANAERVGRPLGDARVEDRHRAASPADWIAVARSP